MPSCLISSCDLPLFTGALSEDAACFVDADDAACSVDGAMATPQSLAQLTEHFSGAELAGLVRSAASSALEPSSTF